MRSRLLLLVAAVCLLPILASAQRLTVQPSGKTFFLDDIIEIRVDVGKREDSWVWKPRSLETSNLDVDIHDWTTDGRVTIQIRLTPKESGPASFGPAEFRDRDGKVVLARVPRMSFDIQPPLDDGIMPIEDVFALQRRNKRVAATVRPEIEGERRVGRPIVFRWVLFSEQPMNILSDPRIEPSNAKTYRSSSSRGPSSWTSLGGSMVVRRVIMEAILLPGSASPIENDPSWATIVPGHGADESLGTRPFRRRAVLPTVEIGERLTPEKIPVGSFEIECPTKAILRKRYLAGFDVGVSGDGSLQLADLRVSGDAPTAILVGQHGFSEPTIKDGQVRFRGTLRGFATPVSDGQEEVAIPSLAFDYYDPQQNRKVTLTCEAKVLQASRMDLAREPKPAQKRSEELPPESEVFLYILEGAAAVFVLVTGLGLRRAIIRR